MPDRLSPLDASFLFAEQRTAGMHVGAVMTFDAADDFDVDAFVALIGHRLASEGWDVKEHDVLDAPAPEAAPVVYDDEIVDIASPDHLAELRDRLLNA